MTVKCVVWDLDGTVWDGVALELAPGAAPPPVRPAVLRAMDVLTARGVLHSVASRTEPATADLVAAHPQLAGRFLAPQFGWGDKGSAVARIAASLGIDLSTVAFVDDDPYERAEVAAAQPSVLVFTPSELLAAVDGPAFGTGPVTAESAARHELYVREQRRRHAEETFAGSREEFLRWCDMRFVVGPATAADVPRLAELVRRTNRFNSGGAAYSADEVAARVADPAWWVPVGRLTDRFGDYGLVAAAFVSAKASGAVARLIMVSCRAAGREVPAALVHVLVSRGVRQLDLRPSEANLGLRMVLRRLGFRAVAAATDPARPARLERADEPLEDLPAWLTVEAP
ncbi:MAG TPA: hypothetical protein VGD67_27240 [Pseudonocardiaceae bacterium]